MNDELLKYSPECETVDEYVSRMCSYKQSDILDITWQDLANRLNEECGFHYSSDRYRKLASKAAEKCISEDVGTEATNEDEELTDVLDRIKREKVKLSDERTQLNAYIRQLSREETLKEIALSAAKIMSDKKILDGDVSIEESESGTEAILMISDWHYGIETNNYWNRYNPDIAVERITKLFNEAIKLCVENKVSTIRVVNLSDLVSGIIHLQIRVQNRYDLITQVMQVSEILAEALSDLSRKIKNVYYYDCLDNHSRISPNKKESINLESVTRIIKWYLIERLKDFPNIYIGCNLYGEDIIDFKSAGFNVIGVHGDRDTQKSVVSNMALMCKKNIDLVLTGHYHHFSCDEENGVLVISNGSLMGTDDYAQQIRKTGVPSQTLIINKVGTLAKCIYRIVLE